MYNHHYINLNEKTILYYGQFCLQKGHFAGYAIIKFYRSNTFIV